MPAMIDCIRITPLTCLRPSRWRMAASTSIVKSSLSGSGPSRATPSTSCGSRTTWMARPLRVPASVMSRPGWASKSGSSITMRAASGFLLLGRAGPAEVDDDVHAARVDVEELAVPRHVVDERAVKGVQRRVEGLQRAERRQVDAADRAADQTTAQVLDEGFDLRQLGNGGSLGRTTDAGSEWRMAQPRTPRTG